MKRRIIWVILFSLIQVSCSALSPSLGDESSEGGGKIVCLVTDTKGLGDRSFNDTAWKGVTDAQGSFGIEPIVIESAQAQDYSKNIEECIKLGSTLNVTVGYLIGDATASAAQASPQANFAIVDYSYKPAMNNVLGIEFSTDQAAFLAGYLAAGVTRTGRVGTFGGVNIPTVTIFMDGFSRGVEHYNQVHNSNVEIIGWDPELKVGLFTGTFDVAQRGVRMGELLIEKGVDVIMPVAGGVGQGTAMVAMERGGVLIIGVDTDWTVSSEEFTSITLTSVLKRMDLAVFEAIGKVLSDRFEGGTYLGTLENNGVGLASFHELDHLVSADLVAELEQVKAEIISGDISSSPLLVP